MLIILFITSHTDTTGNENRLNLLDYIASKFQCVIFTNCPGFLKNRFPLFNILFLDILPSRRILFRKFAFCCRFSKKINKIKGILYFFPFDVDTFI